MTTNAARALLDGQDTERMLTPLERDLAQLHRSMERMQDDRDQLDAEAFALLQEQAHLRRRERTASDMKGEERDRSAQQCASFETSLQEIAIRREELTALLLMLERRRESLRWQLGEGSVAAPPDRSREVSMVQRRAHPRLGIEVHIGLSTEDSYLAGLSGDLSEGGMFVAVSHPIEVGTVVDLTVNLPGRIPIYVTGEVRWRRHADARAEHGPPGVGIRFLDLSEGERATVVSFIRDRMPLLYEELG